MQVKKLIELLKKMDPEANVYFRKGRTLSSVTIVRENSHLNTLVELTNEENAHIR